MKTHDEIVAHLDSEMWAVHQHSDTPIAKFMYPEDAARFVAGFDGMTVRHMTRIVWTEGAEHQSAGESYNDAAATMCHRVAEMDQKRTIRKR